MACGSYAGLGQGGVVSGRVASWTGPDRGASIAVKGPCHYALLPSSRPLGADSLGTRKDSRNLRSGRALGGPTSARLRQVIAVAVDFDQRAAIAGSQTKRIDSPGGRMNTTAETFIAALRKAQRHQEPFKYWLLQDVLPASVCDAIGALPFSPLDEAVFDGRREANNAKRIYFTPAHQQRFSVCQEVADALRSSRTSPRFR